MMAPIKFYFIKLNKQEPKPTNNVMFSLTYYIYNLHISVFLGKGGRAVSSALVSGAQSKVSGVYVSRVWSECEFSGV